MTYNLANDFHRKQFLARSENLLDKGAVVELREVTGRSAGQNRYLHLVIGVVAMETGNTLAYVKEWYFKKLCNKDLFITSKVDKYVGQIEEIKSSADLTKEEMSMAIDRFKRWGAENGMYMPSPGDESLLREIAIEMGRNKAYL